MFPGYGVTAAHYESIAERLASWGYAVIQASWTGTSESPVVHGARAGMLGQVQLCLVCGYELQSRSMAVSQGAVCLCR